MQRHNRRGIVAGGLIPGYAAYKHAMPVAEYVDKVVAGELFDATLQFPTENRLQCAGCWRTTSRTAPRTTGPR
ncbi:MAG: hypothetical protein R2838_10485 [Caldilineaceae bacterium]